jgi:hypothetical protein
LVLARKEVSFSATEGFSDLVTARLHLVVRAMDMQSGRTMASFAIDATGAGADNHKAEAMAIERAMSQYAKRVESVPSKERR